MVCVPLGTGSESKSKNDGELEVTVVLVYTPTGWLSRKNVRLAVENPPRHHPYI